MRVSERGHGPTSPAPATCRCADGVGRHRAVRGFFAGLASQWEDVPGGNDFRNLLGEILIKRFGLTTINLSRIFPQHTYRPIGGIA